MTAPSAPAALALADLAANEQPPRLISASLPSTSMPSQSPAAQPVTGDGCTRSAVTGPGVLGELVIA